MKLILRKRLNMALILLPMVYMIPQVGYGTLSNAYSQYTPCLGKLFDVGGARYGSLSYSVGVHQLSSNVHDELKRLKYSKPFSLQAARKNLVRPEELSAVRQYYALKQAIAKKQTVFHQDIIKTYIDNQLDSYQEYHGIVEEQYRNIMSMLGSYRLGKDETIQDRQKWIESLQSDLHQVETVLHPANFH